MKLADRRALTTTEGLGAIDLAQLDVIAKLYFGSSGPLTIDDDFAGDPIAARVLSCVDRWKVLDGARHAYDLWEYMSDSGTMFKVGTTDVVAEIIQTAVQCDDTTLADALDAAIEAAHAKPATKKPAKKPATAKKPKKPAAKKPKKLAAKKPKKRSAKKR